MPSSSNSSQSGASEPSPLVAALTAHYDELVSYARGVLVSRAGSGAKATGNAHEMRDIAREAVHEVCLQLLQQLPEEAQQIQVPIAFLRTLSKRRVIDNLRSEAVWRRLASSMEDHPECLDQAAGGHAEPEHRLYAQQQFALLVQAIESLPTRCREVFILHKIHEWPQSQVAEHLGISVKTVEKHIRVGITCCRFAMADILG